MQWLAVVLIIIGCSIEVVQSKVADETADETVKKPFKHTNSHTGKFGLRLHTNTTYEKRRQGGTLPTIYIVGAQKGGSSSLFELMVEHPQLCTGSHKENHFFDHKDNYEMGTHYFREMYSDPKCDHIAGTHFIDGTPILHYPSTWQRIYDTYSESPIIRDNLKFIALLREPTAREYSWYQHSTRTDVYMGQKFRDIQTMNETYRNNATFFRKGRYLEQLQAFTRVFKRRQIMILSSEGIFKNTTAIMEQVRRFIGVNRDETFTRSLPHDDHIDKMAKEGVADCITDHVPALDCWVRDTMGKYYEPFNRKLYAWIKSTSPQADPHEPPFYPEFGSPYKIPCVSDARAMFDLILDVDRALKPPKKGCKTRNRAD